MRRLNDLEQMKRELEDFHSKSQEVFKVLDELTELIQAFSHLKQAYDSELKHADKLHRYMSEVEQTWAKLEPDVRATLELLSHTETELRNRFDKLLKNTDQRWEHLLDTQSDMQMAHRNLRTELGLVINDLRDESEDRFSEFNQILNKQASQLDEGIEGLDVRMDKMFNTMGELQQETAQRWERFQEDLLNVQNNLQTAHHNLRTELGRMVNDLRGESEDRFSEFNQNLDLQANKLEESIDVLDYHVGEVVNAMDIEIKALRGEFRECFDAFDLQLADLDKRTQIQQKRLVWVIFAQLVLVGILFLLYLW